MFVCPHVLSGKNEMKRFAVLGASLLASWLGTPQSQAATANAFVRTSTLNSCTSTSSDVAFDRAVEAVEACTVSYTNSSGNGSGASAIARASTGSVGIGASGVSNFSFDASGMYNGGGASASYRDEFRVGNPLATSVELFWELEGEAILFFFGGAGGTASVSAQVNGSLIGASSDNTQASTTIEEAAPFYAGETGSTFISILGEQTSIDVSLGLSWDCGPIGNGVLDAFCGFEGAFENSLVLTGARAFDADGNEIESTIRSDATGFDFVAGYSSGSSQPPSLSEVPLPAGLPMLLSALLLVGYLRNMERNRAKNLS